MTDYTPYQYSGKTILVERYLLLGEQECADYDLFDRSVHPFALEKMEQIGQNGCDGCDVFSGQNRQLFNTFQDYKNAENKKVFLYSEIHSKTRTKTIFCILGAKNIKFWVNGECVSIHSHHSLYYLSVPLNKGRNVLLVEQYAPAGNSVFSVQVLNYKFETGGDFKALANMRQISPIDVPILVCEPVYVPDSDSVRFMYMINPDKYLPDYRIDIHDSSIGFFKSINAKTNEPVVIDAAELRALHEENVRHEWIGCCFKEKNGREIVAGFCAFTKDFNARADQIISELEELSAERESGSKEYVSAFLDRRNSCSQREDPVAAYWCSWQLKVLLDQLKSGSFRCRSYLEPGMHELYIHSDLDDSSVRILARIPEEYDGKKALPAVLALATSNDGGYCWGEAQMKTLEGFLVFDITGRGFTGGSYVGEASTLELINWIFANYRVDCDRIYVLGQSNGGFATWALAQNMPHFAAAIYPHIGYPTVGSIENIANVPVYQTVSPKDHVFIGRANEVKRLLKAYGNYRQFDFTEMMHMHFSPYLFHLPITKELVSHKRELYPERVIYKTVRNRHLESFWVKLHGIARGSRYGKITAKIENPAKITVQARHIDGVTVTLPPQVDKKSFEVTVNRQTLRFTDFTKSKLILRKDQKKWAEAELEPPVDYRKGTGLLDVYMDSLRLIIPEHASDALVNTAEKFSRPCSNGYDPQVCVNYPVYKENEVPRHIFGHNLILLESGEPNAYVRRFADRLPVECGREGFTYGGDRTDGAYVAMQVVPSPYDPRRSILVVAANDEALLKKHILLRKVIIPTYINGLHPLWNNEILIFDGKNYFAAYETGDRLAQLQLTK